MIFLELNQLFRQESEVPWNSNDAINMLHLPVELHFRMCIPSSKNHFQDLIYEFYMYSLFAIYFLGYLLR